MRELMARERVDNAIARKPVDRLPVCEGFWAETVRRWTDEGHLSEGEDLVAHVAHLGSVGRAHAGVDGGRQPAHGPVAFEQEEVAPLSVDW